MVRESRGGDAGATIVEEATRPPIEMGLLVKNEFWEISDNLLLERVRAGPNNLRWGELVVLLRTRFGRVREREDVELLWACKFPVERAPTKSFRWAAGDRRGVDIG